ncbi:DUF4339 domain-containing protein [Pedobacter sp.]|uniref:DUF4339 domain-containing protein n=1 Tax=Pedobacter sp. TaxID=1411316 RepID=UPI0031D7B93A
MISYYYLDGIEKKGPYSHEEIKLANLSPTTLIWTEGMDNWTAIKDVPTLQVAIPPPIPEELVADLRMKSVKHNGFKVMALYLIPLFIGLTIVYYKLDYDKDYYQKDLRTRIDNLMNSRSKVTSAAFTTPTVMSLKLRKPNKLPKIKRQKSNSSLELLRQFDFDKIGDNKDEYSITSGGFSYIELSKQDDGYELATTRSGNLVFKPITSPFLTKPTVDEAYQHAYNYLLEQDKTSLDFEKYAYLLNFEYIANDLYSLANVPNSITLKARTYYSNMIYNATYEVSVNTEKLFFKPIIKQDSFNDLIIKYSLIAAAISLLFSTMILIINPSKSFR